jgi:hypothetical protein
MEMSYGIGDLWACASNKDAIANYISLVKTDHAVNFYFRLISEWSGIWDRLQIGQFM